MGMRMLEAMGRQTLKIPFSQQTQFWKVSWIGWEDVFLLYGQTWCNVLCHTCEVTLVLKVSLAWSHVNFVLVVLRELMGLGSYRHELGSWEPLGLLITAIQFSRNQGKQHNLWVFAQTFWRSSFSYRTVIHQKPGLGLKITATSCWPCSRGARWLLALQRMKCICLCPPTVVCLQAVEQSPKERKLKLVGNECHEIELEILSFLRY